MVLVMGQSEHKHPFCSWIVSDLPRLQKTRFISLGSELVGHLLQRQRCTVFRAACFCSALDMCPIIISNLASKDAVGHFSSGVDIPFTNAEGYDNPIGG